MAHKALVTARVDMENQLLWVMLTVAMGDADLGFPYPKVCSVALRSLLLRFDLLLEACMVVCVCVCVCVLHNGTCGGPDTNMHIPAHNECVGMAMYCMHKQLYERLTHA